MRKLSLLAAALVGTLAIAVTPASAVTGNFIKDFEHPYVGLVAFYDDEGNFMWRCSGSLLTDRVFLTAGHCTDQDAEESPVMARIWFHQNVGGAFNPPAVPEDPNTGYPNRCLEGDPLCVESTLLFDFGFDNFAGFPNIHDVGLIILPEEQAVELPEYGQLAEAGYLDALLAGPRGSADITFTISGYGVSRTNPAQAVSFRERLMALAQLVNLNESANTAGFNLQLSGNPGGGRGGLCFGDSGGPVFYGGFSSNVIVGVNSWLFGFNRQTCGGTAFAFRTDTAAVIEWILGIVERYAPGELDEIQFVEAP
jgi:Trypsin